MNWARILYPQLKKAFEDFYNGKFWAFDSYGELIYVEIEVPIKYAPLFDKLESTS